MTGLEGEQIGADSLPAALGSAADDLRSTVERQVREIVEAAKLRAAEIERIAHERAAETERDSKRGAERTLDASRQRAQLMLETIERLEAEVDIVMTLLRGEAQSLLLELGGAHSAVRTNQMSEGEPSAQPQQAQPPPQQQPQQQTGDQMPTAPQRPPTLSGNGSADPDQTPQPMAAVQPEATHQAAHATAVAQTTESQIVEQPAATVIGAPVTAEPDPAVTSTATDWDEGNAANPDAREVARAQIMGMFHAGKSRMEAEEFLMRTDEGQSHIDLIDEIYFGQDPPAPRRRSLFRRRH